MPLSFQSSICGLALPAALAITSVCSCLHAPNTWAHADHGEHADASADAQTDASRALRITGSGQHTYDLIEDWPAPMADGSPVGPLHGGVIVAPDGTIYASTDRQGQGLYRFTPEGELLGVIGGEELVGIHGMNLLIEGGTPYIYAAQAGKKRALKIDLLGNIVWQISFDKVAEHYPEGDKKFKPTAAAVAPNGDVFVADGYGKSLIHRFDKDLNLIQTFGGWAKTAQGLRTPHGLAIDARYDPARLLVCDRENRRLVHFTLEGEYIDELVNGLRRPCAVSILGEYVAIAELQGRVTIIDKHNTPIAFLGDNPEPGQWAKFRAKPEEMTPGVFTAPHGLSFDADGNVYVSDWNQTGRLTRFDRRYPVPTPKPKK